jgi:hypothetical protein
MKIKHAVVLSEEELTALFDIPARIVAMSFGTVEEQLAALASVKNEFETLQNRYLQTAFKKGKKLGKVRRKEKDTELAE